MIKLIIQKNNNKDPLSTKVLNKMTHCWKSLNTIFYRHLVLETSTRLSDRSLCLIDSTSFGELLISGDRTYIWRESTLKYQEVPLHKLERRWWQPYAYEI